MSMHLSHVNLVGNIAAPAEMKVATATTKMAIFRLAVNPRYQNRDGVWVDGQVSFLSVQCWGRLAEEVVARTRVGMPVLVMGKLIQGTWKTKDENDNEVTRSRVHVRASHIGPDMSRLLVTTQEIKPPVKAIEQQATGEGTMAGETTGADAGTVAASDTASGDRELVGAGVGSGAGSDGEAKGFAGAAAGLSKTEPPF